MFNTDDKTRRLALAILLSASACIPRAATAQSAATPVPPPPAAPPSAPPAKPQTFTGCVFHLPTDKDTLVLSTDTACARLTGTFSPADIDGHQIDLKGILTPRTSSLPASIQVNSVVKIGKACTDVCSLRPPGTRGLRGPEKPGKEGGTPGETTTPPAVPPQ